MKRLLNCTGSDFQAMSSQELRQSIFASEGRTVLAEVISTVQPLYPEISNAELAKAFGADLILLNFFDVFNPKISGIEAPEGENVIQKLKKLTGLPIGINLEPVDASAHAAETLLNLPEGRTATEHSLREAKKFGFDFICLTGNPKTGVTNTEIEKAIQRARSIFEEDILIMAGKMHAAGVTGEAGASILNTKTVESFIDAGADIILLPSPGTVPGIRMEQAAEIVEVIHRKDALAMSTIGTSQEGADEQTIKQLALSNKMIGADLHHIGDAGYFGIAIPENIMAYSIAIRGKRHTYIRMAASINR